MKIIFDPTKNKTNLTKHGLSLADAAKMDIREVIEDTRIDYGEMRYRAWGYIGEKPCSLVFTITKEGIRAISLRRAHEKEIKKYVKK